MAFLEDPRLRQRWNQISHTTETVTENAAAGIWSFGHTYVTPCFSSIFSALESCSTVCLGDREERARRARERQRARGRAEYSFDFYDDWDEELGGGDDAGGLLGSWRGEDWDQLLAGTGKKRSGGDVQEQPKRKRGMSYGTKGPRRRSSIHEDPTIIPSTAPLGFLGRLPFKIGGGPLRYKPSAANLQEHPGASRSGLDTERVPLLDENDDEAHTNESQSHSRNRSGTVGSGDTSDSYRSRGDLFPSDEEGEEDAIPLDDEFAIALDHADDRESSKTRSSKGKRIADRRIPRSVSRATIDSARPSLHPSFGSGSVPESPALLSMASLEDLRLEEERLEREENEVVEKKRQVAADLALRRGLSRDNLQIESVQEVKSEIVRVERPMVPQEAIFDKGSDYGQDEAGSGSAEGEAHQLQSPAPKDPPQEDFVPARLPYFR